MIIDKCMNRCKITNPTHLVEVGIGTASQEAVQLVKYPVRIQPLHHQTASHVPSRGEADTGPRSWVRCGLPS